MVFVASIDDLIQKQNRDGLPAELTEEKRFFELLGYKKTALPTGWNNPENWKYLDDIPENKPFGFAIGNQSNYLLVDGDHVLDPENNKYCKWAFDIFARLQEIAPTYAERSMSGTGFHMIYDLGDFGGNFEPETNADIQKIVAMDPVEYRKLPEAERDKTPKIELFYHQTGRYVYLTGKHKEGAEPGRVASGESAALAFQELIKIREEFHAKYSKGETAAESTKNGELDPLTRERVLSALPYISAQEREIWVRIGIALYNSGFDMSVWDEWSKWADQRNGVLCDKYKPEEIPKIWKSFEKTKSKWNAGTIIILAKANGWKSPENAALDSGQAQTAALPQKLSAIDKKKADWLIPGYIPLNGVTLVAADGGAGKTTAETAITAAVSSGKRPFLLGFQTLAQKEREEREGYAESANVLFLSGEDFAAYTLREKIENAGGDTDRVFIVDPTNPNIKDYYFGSELLRKAIEEIKPRLVVIDPLQSFLKEDVNMIARNQMRQAMIPVAHLAEEHHLAVVIAVHSNKRDAASGRNRVSDSSDIWDFARSVLMVGMTGENNIRYVSHEKSNWGALEKTVLFRIGEDGTVSFLRYSDKKDKDYQEEKRTQRTTERDAPKREDAEKFILSTLKDAEDRKLPAGNLKSLARDEGISEATFRAARESLGSTGKIKKLTESRGKGRGAIVYYQLGDCVDDAEPEELDIHNLKLEPIERDDDARIERPDIEGHSE